MAFLGLGVEMVVLFVGFGLVVGVLFGFFGMGGSFLVTPALLVVGYPATVAVGSGLAFVFGTSVVGALRHRAYGQISYTLAAVMALGMTLGIEVGTRVVFLLAERGRAGVVVSVLYVGLLGGVGLFVLRDARTRDVDVARSRVATAVRAVELPPVVSLPGGATVSVWVVLAVGSGVGVLSGCLGVGGGFLLLPVMVYAFGVPAAVAAGTSLLQIAVSGAYGTYVYAQANAVDGSVVAVLLVGSVLGARVGAGATRLVNEADVKVYFAVTLLVGSVATASKQVGVAYGVAALETAGAVLIFGAALLVSGAIVSAAVAALRRGRRRRPPTDRTVIRLNPLRGGMTDDGERRGGAGSDEQRDQPEREHEAVRDRADEAEPMRGDPGDRLGDLDDALETHDYPTTTEELVAAYGDYEIETQGGEASVEEVLARTDDQTYDSADDVRRRILGLIHR